MINVESFELVVSRMKEMVIFTQHPQLSAGLFLLVNVVICPGKLNSS